MSISIYEKTYKYYYIYKITNKINGKIYIGQHKTNKLNDKYMGSGTLLKRAFKKYGIKNFEKEIIKYYNSIKELDKAEKYYIKYYNSTDVNKGYNICDGGFGTAKLVSDYITYYNKELDKEIRIKNTEQPPSGYTKGRRPFSQHWRDSLARKGEKNGMYGSHRIGKTNPCYGKKWIYNIKTLEIKYINRDTQLSNDWKYGNIRASHCLIYDDKIKELKSKNKTNCLNNDDKKILKKLYITLSNKYPHKTTNKNFFKYIKNEEKIFNRILNKDTLLNLWSNIRKEYWENKPNNICPYCGKEGRGVGFYHWHMNNCKYKK